MTDNSDTDTEPDTDEWTAENSDASQPPSVLEERDREDDVDWHCAQCGHELDDAQDLAEHDCVED